MNQPNVAFGRNRFLRHVLNGSRSHVARIGPQHGLSDSPGRLPITRGDSPFSQIGELVHLRTDQPRRFGESRGTDERQRQALIALGHFDDPCQIGVVLLRSFGRGGPGQRCPTIVSLGHDMNTYRGREGERRNAHQDRIAIGAQRRKGGGIGLAQSGIQLGAHRPEDRGPGPLGQGLAAQLSVASVLGLSLLVAHAGLLVAPRQWRLHVKIAASLVCQNGQQLGVGFRADGVAGDAHAGLPELADQLAQGGGIQQIGYADAVTDVDHGALTGGLRKTLDRGTQGLGQVGRTERYNFPQSIHRRAQLFATGSDPVGRHGLGFQIDGPKFDLIAGAQAIE